MQSASERLALEDQILREIRLSLSMLSTVSETGPHRKGTVYASSAITTGRRLYIAAQRNGFTDVSEFRRAMPDFFNKEIFQKNLRDGVQFGEELRTRGWRKAIVPGAFFANGWTQEHYMSLWRQVIVRHARTIAFNTDWQWSLGCTEEFLIGLQNGKKLIRRSGYPFQIWEALADIRYVMDVLDKFDIDFKRHYELWRQITLTAESLGIKTPA